jgi:Icc-related predicted phosphoesterase
MPLTKLFYASDLHGSNKCFMKFINAAKFYEVDALILGGDITGKMVIPFVRQRDGTVTATYLGIKRVLKTESEIEKLANEVRNSGFYPYAADTEEMLKLNSDPKLVDQLFSRLMNERIHDWIDIAEKKLKDSGVKCYLMPGNDDRLEIDDAFRESKSVINPEGKVIQLDNAREMISTGYANITPWNAPRDIPEGQLKTKIDAMASKVTNMHTCIFNFHCPPYNSSLDFAPQVDDQMRTIMDQGAGLRMIPVGSKAVREAIEKHQPLLSLHGHIHESKGACKIGRTVCLNAGSEYTEGILRGMLVNIDRDKVNGYFPVSG